MARSRRDKLVISAGLAAVIAIVGGSGAAIGVQVAYAASFAIGMTLAWVGLVGLAGKARPADEIGALESVLARTVGGLMAVLALAMVQYTRYGAPFVWLDEGLAIPILETVQDVTAASLAGALLMRLPQFVELGNAPLGIASPEQSDS